MPRVLILVLITGFVIFFLNRNLFDDLSIGLSIAISAGVGLMAGLSFVIFTKATGRAKPKNN